jgi:predicted RNase H-like nuclease (RuvC/YqgF family)
MNKQNINMYEEEILTLQSVVQEQTITINTLNAKIENYKCMIKQLENALLDTENKSKKTRKLSEESKVKYLFYKEHKNDKDIINPLQKSFNDLGYKSVPWQIIKMKTDELYHKLNASSETKQMKS